MSDVVALLVQQVMVMALLMAAGFAAFKAKLVDSAGAKQVSNLVLYVATPAMVVNSFIAPFDAQRLVKAGWTFAFAGATFVFAFILVKTVFRGLSNIGKFGVLFSNVGFLGIPLVQMVLGQESVFYMAMTVAMMTLISFTYGMFLVSGDRSAMSVKKVFTNPPIIAVISGLLIYCLQISFPATVTRTISMLSGITAPLSMMVLGCYLAEADMKKVFSSKETWLILLGRLILVPALVLIMLRFVPASLDEIKAVTLIAASTPIAGILGMLTQKYGGDYAYGAGVVSLSTILSLVTMPLFLALLG